jgi:hypothetical protein
MSDRFLDGLRKLITGTLAIMVMIASTRQYAIAYRLTEPDPRWAFVASVVVVGTILLALLYPANAASRVGFWGLLLAAGAAWIVNAATPLGLTQYSPLVWKGLILAMAALPAPLAFWVLRDAVSPPRPEPRRLTVNQPNQPTQPTAQPTEEEWLDDDQPEAVTIEKYPPGVVEQEALLSEEVKKSVMFYAREGSYKLAAQRLGKNPETIRKNCIKAKEVAPLWYATKVKE